MKTRTLSRMQLLTLSAAILSTLFFSQTLQAVEGCEPQLFSGLATESQLTTFDLHTSGIPTTAMTNARAFWENNCSSMQIPGFRVNPPSSSGNFLPVSVTLVQGRSPGNQGTDRCGLFDPESLNGEIITAEITIWTETASGVPCDTEDVLIHELGHLLGLDDNEDCLGVPMGPDMHGICPGCPFYEGSECEVAANAWRTADEESAIQQEVWCQAYGCSPILIDLEGDGIHLTGIEDPVRFDINGDGEGELITWTDRSEGFLALDRNGNNTIDNGGELFGDVTLLASGSRAENGYEALAELDSSMAGGNEDRRIDSADESFDSLRMWTDLNHDGISQSEELQTLDEAGIQRIGLEYKESRRRDRHGNEFRFLGRAWRENANGIVRPVLSWDVFFLRVP